MKWNEYTWYSKWASLAFFLIILPSFSFYLGTVYKEAITPVDGKVPSVISISKEKETVSLLEKTYLDEKITFKYTDKNILCMVNGKKLIQHDKECIGSYIFTLSANEVEQNEPRKQCDSYSEWVTPTGNKVRAYERTSGDTITSCYHDTDFGNENLYFIDSEDNTKHAEIIDINDSFREGGFDRGSIEQVINSLKFI